MEAVSSVDQRIWNSLCSDDLSIEVNRERAASVDVTKCQENVVPDINEIGTGNEIVISLGTTIRLREDLEIC